MAFATTAQLGTHLGRDLSSISDQTDELLDNATAVIQTAIGQLLHPRATVTVPFHVRPWDAWIHLPQQPVSAVSQVDMNGTTLDVDDWDLVDGAVWLDYVTPSTGSPWAVVEVTFTYGYATVPDDLKFYCMVLASQMLAATEKTGSTSTAGVQSHTSQIDDWSEGVTYATGPGATSSLELPPAVANKLRDKYGIEYLAGSGRRFP